jgi:catechol 2,3-dioxygenase-like lactoylglutathione lyase family enzyme
MEADRDPGDGDGSLRVELFVADLDRSAGFYVEVLGFRVERNDPGYVAVRRGSATIGIGLMSGLPAAHPILSRSGERGGLGVELVIEVPDVDALYRSVVASGWPVATPPGDRPWGLRDFRLLDPDGYYVRVTSR